MIGSFTVILSRSWVCDSLTCSLAVVPRDRASCHGTGIGGISLQVMATSPSVGPPDFFYSIITPQLQLRAWHGAGAAQHRPSAWCLRENPDAIKIWATGVVLSASCGLDSDRLRFFF